MKLLLQTKLDLICRSNKATTIHKAQKTDSILNCYIINAISLANELTCLSYLAIKGVAGLLCGRASIAPPTYNLL